MSCIWWCIDINLMHFIEGNKFFESAFMIFKNLKVGFSLSVGISLSYVTV